VKKPKIWKKTRKEGGKMITALRRHTVTVFCVYKCIHNYISFSLNSIFFSNMSSKFLLPSIIIII